MGTRSITRVIHNGKPILTFYRQMDGYPSGHGLEMADFMAGIEFVNGYNGSHSVGKNANGAGCFAAQLISRLKGDSLGSIYLRDHDADGEEYVYTINISSKQNGQRVRGHVDFIENVKCEGYGKADSYDGDLAGFVAFCNKPSHSNDEEE